MIKSLTNCRLRNSFQITFLTTFFFVITFMDRSQNPLFLFLISWERTSKWSLSSFVNDYICSFKKKLLIYIYYIYVCKNLAYFLLKFFFLYCFFNEFLFHIKTTITKTGSATITYFICKSLKISHFFSIILSSKYVKYLCAYHLFV